MTSSETFAQQLDRYHEALKKTNESNKSVVFDALKSAGISSVLVEFDGEGDSGQIESIQAFTGEHQVAIPATTVTIERLYWGAASGIAAEEPLADAVETLCYDFLTQEHEGWENNEGAYGEFTLHVEQRTIELEFNARYVDVITHNRSL